ncbi:hypothetical protein H8E07_08515 [bacterium]|nr:hypothetical protein [bacterium]
MKTTITMLLLLVIATTALAQDPDAGLIVLSADPAGESCSAYDYAPGLFTLHVVILDASCLTACQFSVAPPPLI